MSISTIHESDSASSITSQPVQILFCKRKGIHRLHNIQLNLNAYPGEEFNISVITLDQTGSPVPTTVYIEKGYHLIDNYYARLLDEVGDRYHLSPSRQPTNGNSCTNLTYKLYSAYEYINVDFKLYHKNPCQSLVDGLKIDIFIKPCPLGLELAESQQCDCDKRLLKFTHKCSVHKHATTIEREKNNFWITQIDFDILLIHEFRCPLDYCKDIPKDVSLSDPSVQCDFNRTAGNFDSHFRIKVTAL